MASATVDSNSGASVGISRDTALVRKVVEYFGAIDEQEEAQFIEASLQAKREATVVAATGEVGCGGTTLVDTFSESVSINLSACETGLSFGPDTEEIPGQGNFGSREGAIRDGELLTNDSLIDHPGFNSTDLEILKTVIASARNAGVVVFVLETTITITELEPATLKETTASTPGLAVVVIKKNKNPLG